MGQAVWQAVSHGYRPPVLVNHRAEGNVPLTAQRHVEMARW